MKQFSNRLGAGFAWLLISFCAVTQGAGQAEAARCLFVSSYHKGYAWSDGVERGLRSVLKGKCELQQFDMDTKRKKTEDDKIKAGLAAKALIESWQPDIVITADDNAAKYLIQPYYKNQALPFVFCGINWTVAEYGFPYSNVTGMIEVALISPMLEQAREISGGGRRAFYIGAATLTEEKNLKRFQEATAEMGLGLRSALVRTRDDWLAAYREAQDYNFVILGSNAGINDWDDSVVLAEVLEQTRKLSVTNHGWMMPFTLLGITKVPEEQGEWAAKVALYIMDGAAPSSIPIVANSRRDIWVNEAILKATSIFLPERVSRKAKRIKGFEPPT